MQSTAEELLSKTGDHPRPEDRPRRYLAAGRFDVRVVSERAVLEAPRFRAVRDIETNTFPAPRRPLRSALAKLDPNGAVRKCLLP